MEYTVYFRNYKDMVKLYIYLRYEDYVVPAFLRIYENSILENKNEFNTVYNYIKNYFNQTNVNMTKNDLMLFYNTFIKFSMSLPSLNKVNIIDCDIQVNLEDLTPKEILFLSYIHGKSVGAKVAKYFVEEYQLDLEFTYDKLLYYNYITKEDYQFNLRNASVKELSEVLNRYNLLTKGKKADLIETLLNRLDTEIVKKEFMNKYYKLTTIGEKITKLNEHLIEFHKSYYRYANGLNIEEFYVLSKKYIDIDAKDVCKIMVSNKDNTNFNNFDWKTLFGEGNRDKVDQQFIEIVSGNKGRDVVKEERKTIVQPKQEIKMEQVLSKYASIIDKKYEEKDNLEYDQKNIEFNKEEIKPESKQTTYQGPIVEREKINYEPKINVKQLIEEVKQEPKLNGKESLILERENVNHESKISGKFIIEEIIPETKYIYQNTSIKKEKQIIEPKKDTTLEKDDEFNQILKKYHDKIDAVYNNVTHDDFMNVVYKPLNRKDEVIIEPIKVKENKVEIDEKPKLDRYLVKEELKKVIDEIQNNPILDKKLEIETVSEKFYFRWFFIRYVVTIALSILIIYYLYTYVFIQEG